MKKKIKRTTFNFIKIIKQLNANLIEGKPQKNKIKKKSENISLKQEGKTKQT
jgi:hypothetical protein